MKTWVKLACALPVLALLVWAAGRGRRAAVQPQTAEAPAADLRDAAGNDLQKSHLRKVAVELGDCSGAPAEEECMEGVLDAHRRWLEEHGGGNERQALNRLIDDVLRDTDTTRAERASGVAR